MHIFFPDLWKNSGPIKGDLYTFSLDFLAKDYCQEVTPVVATDWEIRTFNGVYVLNCFALLIRAA